MPASEITLARLLSGRLFAMGSNFATLRETVRALLRPMRLVPIVLVSAPLLVAQATFSRDPLAVPLGLLMVVVFVLVAPMSWRVFFPEDGPHGQRTLRLALYASVGAGIVLTLGVAVPKVAGMGQTFLTDRLALLISGALFLVGGWGLGRDVGFERSLARERARTAALEREAEQAQLLALRAHLDPHFLFNTLNAIAEWCRADGETAERAVLQLSAILREMLGGVQATSWPLARELAVAADLLALHALRDADALRARVEPAGALGEVPVPPMILLPLVENAVKHGPAAGHRGEVGGAGCRRGVRAHPGPRPQRLLADLHTSVEHALEPRRAATATACARSAAARRSSGSRAWA